jgi:uncharacterized membrane protein
VDGARQITILGRYKVSGELTRYTGALDAEFTPGGIEFMIRKSVLSLWIAAAMTVGAVAPAAAHAAATKAQKKTRKKTATRVGVGAAGGAVIGALAGGGKGAAVGAAAGGGAGYIYDKHKKKEGK